MREVGKTEDGGALVGSALALAFWHEGESISKRASPRVQKRWCSDVRGCRTVIGTSNYAELQKLPSPRQKGAARECRRREYVAKEDTGVTDDGGWNWKSTP